MEITPVVTFSFYDCDKLCVQSVASRRIGCRGRCCQHVQNTHYEYRIIYYERHVENLRNVHVLRLIRIELPDGIGTVIVSKSKHESSIMLP